MKEYFGLSAKMDHKKMYRQDLTKYMLETKGLELIESLIKMIMSR